MGRHQDAGARFGNGCGVRSRPFASIGRWQTYSGSRYRSDAGVDTARRSKLIIVNRGEWATNPHYYAPSPNDAKEGQDHVRGCEGVLRHAPSSGGSALRRLPHVLQNFMPEAWYSEMAIPPDCQRNQAEHDQVPNGSARDPAACRTIAQAPETHAQGRRSGFGSVEQT